MGSTDKFCLRWNDFESNISVSFRELREDKAGQPSITTAVCPSSSYPFYIVTTSWTYSMAIILNGQDISDMQYIIRNTPNLFKPATSILLQILLSEFLFGTK